MPKNIFTQELEGTRRKEEKKQKERGSRRDLLVLGVRRWTEFVADRKSQQRAVVPMGEKVVE